MSLAVIYNAVLMIVRETFVQLNDVLLPLWLLFDYISDIIYFLDVIVHGTTSKSMFDVHYSFNYYQSCRLLASGVDGDRV